MPGDDYLGAVNWDAIYCEFHNPSLIADKIETELAGNCGDILFAGFSEVAINLANERPLKFVDSSPVVAAKVREKDSYIDEVITSDVCLYAASTPADNLTIVCRISAFWNKSEQFDNLIEAILAYPRKTVLVDFYDSEMI